MNRIFVAALTACLCSTAIAFAAADNPEGKLKALIVDGQNNHGNWPTTTITDAQSGTSPLSVCEVDLQNAYIMLQPEIQRTGLSLRFTKNVGENAQFYSMVNFYKTDTHAQFTPLGFNGALPRPNPAGLAAANMILPVYVCSTGLGTFNAVGTGCDATNGQLNPDNPGEYRYQDRWEPFRVITETIPVRNGALPLSGRRSCLSISITEAGLVWPRAAMRPEKTSILFQRLYFAV